MARIRTIKPEFWTSEQIVSCSRDARLFFIGLWSFADDAGITPASPLRLKMEVFPNETLSEENITALVQELISQGLILEYKAEEKTYWQVTGWGKHQKIARPYYKYPPPISDNTQSSNNKSNSLSNDHGDTKQCTYSEYTMNDQYIDTPGNINRDINRKDISQVANATLHPHKNNNIEDERVVEVFTYWQKTMNRSKAKLDTKRKIKIKHALDKLGFSVDDLKQAIDGCKNSAFHMGKNDSNKRYDGIDLIFRNAEKIEGFIAMAKTSEDCQIADNFEGVI